MTAVVFQSVVTQLLEFNSRFPLTLESINPDVAEVILPFVNNTGKRIRPAITYLCAGLSQSLPTEKHHLFAEVTELIHTASLLHDDVIDAATLRRHKPTFNKLWGNDLAILAGDLLYIHALNKMAAEPVDLREAVHETVLEMTQSEIQQGLLRYRIPTQQQYMSIVTGKTAALIALACYLGASQSELPLARSLQTAGIKIGQAFQVIDDLLDWTGTDQSGKKPYQDFCEGRITLPIIMLLANLPENMKRDVVRIITNPEQSSAENGFSIRSILLEYQIPARVREFAEALIKESLEIIHSAPDSPHKNDIVKLTELVINRDR